MLLSRHFVVIAQTPGIWGSQDTQMPWETARKMSFTPTKPVTVSDHTSTWLGLIRIGPGNSPFQVELGFKPSPNLGIILRPQWGGWATNPKIVQKATDNIHVYMCVYIYVVELLFGPSLAFSIVFIWSKLVQKTLFVDKNYKIGVSGDFLLKKKSVCNF